MQNEEPVVGEVDVVAFQLFNDLVLGGLAVVDVVVRNRSVVNHSPDFELGQAIFWNTSRLFLIFINLPELHLNECLFHVAVQLRVVDQLVQLFESHPGRSFAENKQQTFD